MPLLPPLFEKEEADLPMPEMEEPASAAPEIQGQSLWMIIIKEPVSYPDADEKPIGKKQAAKEKPMVMPIKPMFIRMDHYQELMQELYDVRSALKNSEAPMAILESIELAKNLNLINGMMIC